MKAPLTIRVEVTDLALWQGYAKARSLPLAEWIRRQINAGGEEAQWRPDAATVARVDEEMKRRFPENGEASPTEDVRRTEAVRVAERGAGTLNRRTHRRNGDTVGAIEDIAHETFRAETCEHGALLNQCKVWGCYFYEVANGRGEKLNA